jgi:hypothetical protein
LQAGVPRDLARYYPGILDAVLVIACAAAPVLRDARWWVRCYAWLAILVVVVVIGGIDAVHAMNVALPHRATAGVAAVLPWALLLLAFSLWLTILRHLRAQHLARETEVPDAAEVAEAPVARQALEAAAADDAGDGVAAEETVVAEVDAADGATDGQVQEPAAEGEAATEAVPQADAGTEPDMPDMPDMPDKEALDETPATEPAGEADDTREAATEIPAVTYATGPRLRRVRSLPAPPVGDE